MNECDVLKNEILEFAQPSVEDVLKAKAFIVSHFEEKTGGLLNKFLRDADVSCPASITIADGVDIESQKRCIAKLVRYRLAFAAALWGLIGEGHILPKVVGAQPFLSVINFNITCRIVRGAGHTEETGLKFDELDVALPRELIRVFNPQRTDSALWDADLFLRRLDPRLPHEVSESLRHAVLCFHHGLYLPAVVMLNRANEKAWWDFAKKLLDVAKSKFPGNPKVRDLEQTLSNRFSSFSKVLWSAREIWADNSLKAVLGPMNVRCAELDNAYVWTDAIRNFRNVVHPTAPQQPLDYGIVSALLLGAWEHLNTLYAFL